MCCTSKVDICMTNAFLFKQPIFASKFEKKWGQRKGKSEELIKEDGSLWAGGVMPDFVAWFLKKILIFQLYKNF